MEESWKSEAGKDGHHVYTKSYFPMHVTATDVSEFAVMSLPKWERLFEVRL
jgi:hypothetical protein